LPVLDGKAIAITGSGRGLGAAYARHAASQGARVLVNDVDSGPAEEVVEAIRRAGGQADVVVADISDWDEAERFVSQCVERFGAIDGLVNNAGIETFGPPEEVTETVIRQLVNVNLIGAMFCGTHAIRRMLEQGHGVIVNATSGAQSGMRSQSVYAATKGALASLTYAWAMDLADRSIRVNAISPMAATTIGERAVGVRRSTAGMLTRDPLPSPDSNAPVVTFLLSDAARNINGQVVRIDRDNLALMTHPGVLYPALIKENWSLADVEDAFARELGGRLQPLGVSALEVQPRDYSLPYA
jgi:NAD(P)-dependent dehydrogenase (short-subunit alcohol dehydrogenase family)